MEEFQIIYNYKIGKIDLPKIDKVWGKRIKKSIDEKLRFNPYIFGTPLRNKLKRYSKLRIGDYRVLFYISNKRVFIDLILS